jgi:hypothetical protein
MTRHTSAALIATLVAVGGAATAHDNSGWRARIDALLLAPSVSGPGFGNIFTGAPDNVYFGGSFDDQLLGAYRLVGAKENCTGLGVQFQYFEFDHSVDYNGEWENGVDLDFAGQIDVDVYAFDAEVTQRGCFRNWDLLVSGGLRAGGVGIQQGGTLYDSVASFYDLPSGSEFDGVGPTVALAAERPLGCTGLSLIGRARASLLFGDLDTTPTFGSSVSPITRTVHDNVQVTEIQFGLNYRRCLGPADGSFGVFWEAQRWDSDSDALGDLALHGLGLQTGLYW